MSIKMKKTISAVATVVLFIGLGIYYLLFPAGNGDNKATTESKTETTENTEITEIAGEDTKEDSVEVATYQFRKQQYLDEHFEKHGSEFDYNNADEYLAGANRVINDPNSLYKTESEDGDHIYYLESTNEFVVVATDGYIRTYFKPSGGKSYFDRQ